MPRVRIGFAAAWAALLWGFADQRAVAQVTVLEPQTVTNLQDSIDPGLPAVACPPETMIYDPYVACPQPVVQQWDPYHIGLFGEFIYLTARNADVPFTVPQDGLLIAGATPVGPVVAADPGYSPGFRAGGFFTLGPDARLSAAYTWFTSSTNATATADGANVLNPLVLFPGTYNAGFTAQSASANYDIDFQFIDIDYEIIAERRDLYWWGYSFGARYGQLTQNFGATFPFDPPDGTTSLSTSSNFDGVGPRAGFQTERRLFAGSGLRAYGKGSAAFLVGSFRNSYVQQNEFGGTEVNTSVRSDRIVPVLDLELGVAWLSRGQRVRISGGYLVSAWFNSITTPGWISSVQAMNYNPGAETVTFDGLTARAEVRF